MSRLGILTSLNGMAAAGLGGRYSYDIGEFTRPGSAKKAADLKKRKAASKARVAQRMKAKGKK